jgi:predicted acylesterase/phospholipase RssA
MARPRKPAGRRIGLALAGGGPEGAVYEIGALRALEEALGGVDFNDLDVYVGVSAGSFIASCLANGLTPTQLVRAIVKHEPGQHPFVPKTFFTPAYWELAKRAFKVPWLLTEAIWGAAQRPGDLTLRESLTRLAEALPVGIFDNEPIRRYLEQIFSIPGRTDDFRQLKHQLIVVATDLGSGREIRFGEPAWDHVPISTAVEASTAVPGVYPPVLVDGCYCVDGVLLKTLHASVALEHGAELLLCVNPVVPVDTRAAVEAGTMRRGILIERGLPTTLNQTFRTLVHSRLELGMARYRAVFPKADVVLFEPERDEYGMFFTSIFSFSARRAVCELGYRVTRRDLLRRRRELAPLLKRHGVRLRLDVLEDDSRDVWAGAGLPPGTGGAVTESLERAVARLEALTGTLRMRVRSPRARPQAAAAAGARPAARRRSRTAASPRRDSAPDTRTAGAAASE